MENLLRGAPSKTFAPAHGEPAALYGDEFYIEDMRCKALIKRTKESRRDKKGKILSKKRYGKSIAKKAPTMFLTILEQQVIASGGSFQRVVTWKAKASQFSHETGKCNKKKLSQRWHYLEGSTKVQQDLYLAFLIERTNKALEYFNLGPYLCKRFSYIPKDASARN